VFRIIRLGHVDGIRRPAGGVEEQGFAIGNDDDAFEAVVDRIVKVSACRAPGREPEKAGQLAHAIDLERADVDKISGTGRSRRRVTVIDEIRVMLPVCPCHIALLKPFARLGLEVQLPPTILQAEARRMEVVGTVVGVDLAAVGPETGLNGRRHLHRGQSPF